MTGNSPVGPQDKLKKDVEILAKNLEDVAEALRSLAIVVNQHNIALKMAAEEQEHIIEMLRSSGSSLNVQAGQKRNDKPN